MSTESAKVDSIKQLGVRISTEKHTAFLDECKRSGMTQQELMEKAIAMVTNATAAEKYPGCKSDIETFQSSVAVLTNLYLKTVESREHYTAVAAEERRIALAEAESTSAKLKLQKENLEMTINEIKKDLAEQQKDTRIAIRERDAALAEQKNTADRIAILMEKIRTNEEYKEALETAKHEIRDLQEQLNTVNADFRRVSNEQAVIAKRYFRSTDEKDKEIEELKTKVEMLRMQLIKAKITPIVGEDGKSQND